MTAVTERKQGSQPCPAVSSEMTVSRCDPENHVSPQWGRCKEIIYSLKL